jgi:hypothetical protein
MVKFWNDIHSGTSYYKEEKGQLHEGKYFVLKSPILTTAARRTGFSL